MIGDALAGASFHSGLPVHFGHNADTSTGSFPGVMAGWRDYNYVITDAQMQANAGVI